MGKTKKNQNKKKKTRKPVTGIRLTSTEKKTIISKVHQLNKDKELAKAPNEHSSRIQEKIKTTEQEIQQIGGLEAYQFVSKTTEAHYGSFNSAKWVVQQLKHLDIWPKQDEKLSLLDVGSLDLNYKGHERALEVTAIDLNPQKPSILKADFLQFMKDKESCYDIIVLSLVINFVGDPIKRGEMLTKSQQLCQNNGLVFIILPLACVQNSRYLTDERLESMMHDLGFDLLTSHNSKKLSFKMFQKKRSPAMKIDYKKKQQRDSAKMNNFCIILR